jgi:hypothetical protein
MIVAARTAWWNSIGVYEEVAMAIPRYEIVHYGEHAALVELLGKITSVL